jgi:hypothetical protein
MDVALAVVQLNSVETGSHFYTRIFQRSFLFDVKITKTNEFNQISEMKDDIMIMVIVTSKKIVSRVNYLP